MIEAHYERSNICLDGDKSKAHVPDFHFPLTTPFLIPLERLICGCAVPAFDICGLKLTT